MGGEGGEREEKDSVAFMEKEKTMERGIRSEGGESLKQDRRREQKAA